MIEVEVGLHEMPDVARVEPKRRDLADGGQCRVDRRARTRQGRAAQVEGKLTGKSPTSARQAAANPGR